MKKYFLHAVKFPLYFWNEYLVRDAMVDQELENVIASHLYLKMGDDALLFGCNIDRNRRPQTLSVTFARGHNRSNELIQEASEVIKKVIKDQRRHTVFNGIQIVEREEHQKSPFETNILAMFALADARGEPRPKFK